MRLGSSSSSVHGVELLATCFWCWREPLATAALASAPRSIAGTRAVPAVAGSGNKSASGNNANTNRENARRSMGDFYGL
jgi:hypothetical protein